MKTEWRLSAVESHVLFIAFGANQENRSLKEREGFPSATTWMEILRTGRPLVIAPTDIDEDSFPALVEEELLRLARSEADDILPCECLVAYHRRTLQQFRTRNDLR